MRTLNLSRVPGREKGATLVVALVILVVMSLVGLASISSSTLQSRMAFNKKQKMLSMMAADAALRAGENYLLENIRGVSNMKRFDGNDGLFADAQLKTYIAANAPSVEESFTGGNVIQPSHWTDANSKEIVTLDASVSIKEGRYFIEYLGKYDPAPIPVIDTSKEVTDQKPYMFRVVAIGWGQDPNIYSVLQSTFRTGTDLAY